MHVQDPTGVEVRTEPVFVRAGPQRVSAAFIKSFEGPVEDLMSPHAWSLADIKIGYSYGITSLMHLREMTIGGPFTVEGVSETPSRREIFSCRPESPEAARPCAERILTRLATKAYRRPVRPIATAPPRYLTCWECSLIKRATLPAKVRNSSGSFRSCLRVTFFFAMISLSWFS